VELIRGGDREKIEKERIGKERIVKGREELR
jgi:hypothetical protein